MSDDIPRESLKSLGQMILDSLDRIDLKLDGIESHLSGIQTQFELADPRPIWEKVLDEIVAMRTERQVDVAGLRAHIDEAFTGLQAHISERMAEFRSDKRAFSAVGDKV
jgi:hypothetical protein